jgi:hypothetical protein
MLIFEWGGAGKVEKLIKFKLGRPPPEKIYFKLIKVGPG